MQAKVKTSQSINEVEDSITRMPKFEKDIQVTVSVDSVYEKLLGLLDGDFKHREVLGHAIIGSSLENGAFGYIYNAINGFTNDIDFRVGDVVYCTETERRERYDANKEREDGTPNPNWKPVGEDEIHSYKPDWESRSVRIGQCKVVEINLYAKDKLKVEFQTQSGYDTAPKDKHSWVSHKNCNMVYKAGEVEIVASH